MPKQTVVDMFGMRVVNAYKSKQAPAKTSNDNLLVGVELEIENLPDGQLHYTERAGRFWQVVEDGSLRPRGAAWEFVSHPAQLSVLMTELKLFFDTFKFDERNYSDRCSVHIHTNVQDYTQDELASLCLVYVAVEDVLFHFVNHHKKMEEQGYCRDTNIYCIPWSHCRMNAKLVDKLFNNIAGMRHWQKYTALNLLPIIEKGTVEWRHMHGTADFEKISQWFNIIGAIMAYAKKTPMEDVIKTLKILNDTSAYAEFLHDVTGGYIPYDETYQQALADGVINAKYSLIGYGEKKEKTSRLQEIYGHAIAAQANAAVGINFNVLDELDDAIPPEQVLRVRIPERRVNPAAAVAQGQAAVAQGQAPAPLVWDNPNARPRVDGDAALEAAIADIRRAEERQRRDRDDRIRAQAQIAAARIRVRG